MSWFEPSGITTFARSALKEAQKTIDKALDIQDPDAQSTNSQETLKAGSDTFFAEFGLEDKKVKEDEKKKDAAQKDKDVTQNLADMSSSLWGSFTGSFFENNTSSDKDVNIADKSVVASQPQLTSTSTVVQSSASEKSTSEAIESILKTGSTSFKSIFSTPVKEVFKSSIKTDSVQENNAGWEWDSNEMEPSTSESQEESGKCSEAGRIQDDNEDAKKNTPVQITEDSKITITSASSQNDSAQLVEEDKSDKDKGTDSLLISDKLSHDQGDPEECLPIVKDKISASETDCGENTFKYPMNNIDAPIDNPFVVKETNQESAKQEINTGQNIIQDDSTKDTENTSKTSLVNILSSKELPSSTLENVDIPLTVQPSRSPLKLPLAPINVVDTQVTHEDDIQIQGDEWCDDEDDDIETTLTKVEPVCTITKQPVSRTENIVDSKISSADLFDSSNSLFLSTSSSNTILDVASNSMESSIDSLKIDVQPSTMNSEEISKESETSNTQDIDSNELNPDVKDSVLKNEDTEPKFTLTLERKPSISMSGKNIVGSKEASECVETTLPATLPLDMSIESGGSSDTITASIDSTQLDIFCMNKDDNTPQSLLDDAIVDTKNEDMEFDSIVERDNEMGASKPDDDSKKSSDESERESSPVSSMSVTSGMVKIGDSEQTSADEFETTTSSDIEVISTPSFDGVIYDGNNGPSSNPYNTASKVWASAHQKFKSFLVEPPPSTVSSKSGPQDSLISPSMTASFTSVSESELGWGDLGGMSGGANSPPHHLSSIPQSMQSGSKHYFEHGHSRNQSNMSETSESSGEHSSPEIEKLNKKIRQLGETLEAREMRALELSQQNASLQDTIHNLQQKINDSDSNGNGGTAEMIREEYTDRLANMEKKFQQALKEKEAVNKLLENARGEAAVRLSTVEVKNQLEEKDVIINELRLEGEKLSKQQLQYSTIIKKLRSKEKENEINITNLSSKVETQSTEIERQHRQIVAKSEIERKQVSAITQLTLQVQQIEEALRNTRVDAAETESKMSVLKEALDTAYRELGEAKRQESAREAAIAEQNLSAEVGAKQQLTEALQNLQKQSDREKHALLLQIEELNEEKERIQLQTDKNERQLRAEINQLKEQLSESEGRGEELSCAVAMATRPLLRQIENLQSSHAGHRQSWEELEAQLTYRLQEAEKQVAVSTERERAVREQSAQSVTLKAVLQTQMDTAKAECSTLSAKVQTLKTTVSKLEEEKMKCIHETNEVRSSLTAEIESLKADIQKIKTEVELEKTALKEERRRSSVLQQHLTTAQNEKNYNRSEDVSVSRQGSPTPSLSRISLPGSLNSYNMFGNSYDDVFDSASLRGVPSLYESLRSSTATTVEALTSQLNQREGEVHHLHSEALRHEAQKESLAKELLEISTQMETMEGRMTEFEKLKEAHKDVTEKYNALLQMYGEKVEEVDELRLDLSDVKEMYKNQINQLMQT